MTADAAKRNLIRGAAWMVGTRWLIKGLGFANTVVMARLLMPEDYGIVALAMLVVGLIQTFIDSGPTTALLCKREVTHDEIDSAWTLQLIQGMAAGAILLALSPVATHFFAEPRLNAVLVALSLCMVLSAVLNIGQTLAQMKFIYSLDFKINALSKLVGVVSTVSAGIILGDYRALVIGILADRFSAVVLSYLLHPYRPRWNTSKIGEIWNLTKWLMVANIGTFIIRRGDELVAGRLGSPHEFGLYHVGSDFGQMPVSEIGPAMLNALLPVLSSIKTELERTRSAVIKTTAVINTVIWPVGLGFMAIAPLATEIVLGSKWLDAVPFVCAFSLVSVLQTTVSPARTLLTLLGYTRVQSQVVWFEFLCFVGSAFALVPSFHLAGLAYARVFSSATSGLAILYAASKYGGLCTKSVLIEISRPMIGAFTMHLLVVQLLANMPSTATAILASVSSGAIIYAAWTLATWWLLNRPEGLESTIFDGVANIAKTDRHK